MFEGNIKKEYKIRMQLPLIPTNNSNINGNSDNSSDKNFFDSTLKEAQSADIGTVYEQEVATNNKQCNTIIYKISFAFYFDFRLILIVDCRYLNLFFSQLLFMFHLFSYFELVPVLLNWP